MINKKRVIILIEVLLIIFLIYNGLKIYGYYKEENTDNSLNEEIDIIVKKNKQDKYVSTDKETKDVNIVTALKEEYEDVISFIEIEGTRVSYPVVQYADNEYYLNRSVNKEYNANGSIFMDYRNKPDFTDDNTVLYGHIIKTGKFFKDLEKFKEQEFYNEYDKIKISTENKDLEYIVYSVYVEDPNEDYRMQNFKSNEDKMNFLKSRKDKSIIETFEIDELGKEVEDIKILTLSTCSDKGKNRLVVHGIQK